jgi:type VI secretion system protein VasG
MPSPDGLVRALKPELDKVFKPAFLGRTVIVPYFPIQDAALRRIIVLKLERIQRRIEETHRVRLLCDDALVAEVAKRCTEVESGARNVDNILTNTLLPEVSRLLLEQIAEGRRPESIRVKVGKAGAFEYAAGTAAAATAEEPVTV